MKATIPALAACFLAACGGNSGSNPQQPASMSGVMDTTYGANGKVVFTAAEQVLGAAFDPAGNAYVTGSAVVKIGPAGNRIAGFGGPANPPERSPLPDGAGSLFTVWDDGVVKRDANGQPDTSFGTSGRVQVTPWNPLVPTLPGTALSVLRNATGDLWVTGVSLQTNFGLHTSELFVQVAKVDATGHLVQGFGTAGRKDIGTGFTPSHPGAATALDAQGNVLFAGRGVLGGYFVARLDANGDLDPRFGTSGQWSAPSCGSGTADSSDVSLAASAAGEIYFGASCDGLPTVFKLDAQGNVTGSASGFIASGGSVGAILPSSDGSLYLAGAAPASPCKQLVVTKLTGNLTAVANFGNNGTALVDVTTDDSRKALGLDTSGMLYVGASGDGSCPAAGVSSPYVIVRLHS